MNTQIPLYVEVMKIGSIWLMTVVGYYIFLPILGFPLSYNSTPYGTSAFYIICILISIYSLHHIYRDTNLPIEKRWWVYCIAFVGYGIFVSITTYILGSYPVVLNGLQTSYPEIMSATPMYFIPKTLEVVLQQTLIVALIIALSKRSYSLNGVVSAYAVIFGGAHIWLYFLTDSPTLYNLAITISALVSSLVFPYLILRVKSGFVYSFLVHLAFYVLAAVSFRIFIF